MGFLIKKPKRRIILYVLLNVIFIILIVGLFLDMLNLSNLNFTFYYGNIFGILINLVALICIRYIRFFEIGYIISKANVLCSNNQFSKALELLENKMNTIPKKFFPNWLSIKAMVLIKMGELEKAEEILNQLLSKYPTFQSALYYKSCLESLKDNRKETIKHLKKLLKVYILVENQTKNPISRVILNKWRNNLIELIQSDDDFKNIRGSPEFNNFINTISN